MIGMAQKIGKGNIKCQSDKLCGNHVYTPLYIDKVQTHLNEADKA